MYPSDVGESIGLRLMRTTFDIMYSFFTPPTRRPFIRYWVNFAREYSLRDFEEMMAGLSIIDAGISSTMQYDTEEFRRLTHGMGEGDQGDATLLRRPAMAPSPR